MSHILKKKLLSNLYYIRGGTVANKITDFLVRPYPRLSTPEVPKLAYARGETAR